MNAPFIDPELAAFLARGNSVVVATRNASLEPEATRACGLSVPGPDRLRVLLPRATSSRAVANLRDNGDVAVCVSSPLDFRTVQLKGRCVALEDAGRGDLRDSERQLREFAAAVARVGISRQQARNLWLFDCWRAEIEVTSAFLQTPGPGAGVPVGAERDA